MHKVHGSVEATKLKPHTFSQPNVCVVLEQTETLKYYELPFPEILEPWEVVIEISKIGFCGSDFEYWKKGKIGPYILNQPMIMGHETGGKILALGKQAEEENRLKIGDIVALEPGLVCGECTACKADMYNLCPQVAFFATPPVHGTMRRYMKHHYKYCYTVGNPNTSDKNEDELGELAALCEPLSVGIHAGGKNVAQIKNGDFVGIFGSGPIGIINMLTSIHYGATNIFITDIMQEKLDIVNKYLNDNPSVSKSCKVKTFNTGKNGVKLTEELLANEFGLSQGKCDHAIECVGNEFVLTSALEHTRSGGMVTVIGMAADPSMKMDVSHLNIMEKTINGVFRYRYTYNEAIEMLLSGKVGDATKLITSRPDTWNESELNEAMPAIATNMKIMFQL